MKKLLIPFLVISIFLTGTIIRLVWLGQIPTGLTNDEADVGYDAYSILKTGKDQWGAKQPSTSLQGFGDFRPPVYTYAVVPSVAVFGLNPFAVRFPSAVAGSLTVLGVFIVAVLLFGNEWIGIAAMLFLAVNPWHVAMSRVGIESTFGVFIITGAFICFLKGRKKTWWLIPSVILFVLSIYTYTSYTIFTPLLISGLFISFGFMHKKNMKIVVGCIALFCLLLVPLLAGGKLKTASARSSQVNFTNDIGIINVVNDQRGSCQIDYKGKLCQLFENKYGAFVKVFISNYLNHFSPELLVVHGTQTQFSVLPERGLLSVSEYICVIIGILFLIRKKNVLTVPLVLWLLLAALPDSLTSQGHYSRYLVVLPMFQLLSAVGVVELWNVLNNKKFVFPLLLIFFMYEVLSFSIVYWSYFPVYYSTYSHYGYQDLIRFVHDHEKQYQKIIISNRVNDTKQYAFYLFYSKYDPALYQSGVNVEKVNEANGWVRITRIGNVYFLPSIPKVETDPNIPIMKTLFAGDPKEFPQFNTSLYQVRDLQNHILFDIEEN